MVKWIVCLLAIGGAYLLRSRLNVPVNALDFVLIAFMTGIAFVLVAPTPNFRGAIGQDDALFPGKAALARAWYRRPCWVLTLTLLAVMAGSGAAWWLAHDLSTPFGLGLWLSTIALLVLGWWWLPATPNDAYPPDVPDGPKLRWWIEAVALIFIVVVAFIVRWRRLDLYPNGIQSDEANNARDALLWLSGAPYTPYSEANVGQASLFTYLIAMNFGLFGVNLQTMRLTAVFAGTITVAAFYPLVRKLFRPRVALFATALLAFDRWHMTFSRIVYELILTPLALLLVYYFLYRAMVERRPRDWILAGLAVAFGFNTYTAFRISVIGAAVMILFWLLRDYRRLLANLGWLSLFTFSTIIGLLPLLIYTIQHPDIVLLRTRQVFIGTEIEQVGAYTPLWFNLRRYLGMFHLQGDMSALNNLPGEPLLGMLVGMLAMLGLCYALYHWNKLEMFMLLTWIGGVLPAGILSVTVETPSARRVIGLVPLVYLLVAIVGEAVWRLSVQNWKRTGSLIWQILATIVVGNVAYTQLHQFYYVQMENPSVSEAFNIIESSVGRYLREIDPTTTTVYLDPAFHNNAIVNFLGQNPTYIPFSLIAHLPLINPVADKTNLFVFQPNSDVFKPLFTSFYPTSKWTVHQDEHGMVTFQTFEISAQQFAATRGLTTAYYADLDRTQPPTLIRTEPQVGALSAPLSPPYTVEWSGTLRAPIQGVYTFTLATAMAMTLTIDSKIILTTPSVLPAMTALATHVALPFVGGLHDFQLQATVEQTGLPQPKLDWEGPFTKTEVSSQVLLTNRLPPVGMIGAYYPNIDWQGAPSVVRRDLVVLADESMPDIYSVIWTGKLFAPQTGLYRLGVTSDDGSWVYVDGKLLVDNGGMHGARHIEVQTELAAGLHDLEIRYVQNGGARTIVFEWQPPGMRWVPVAGEYIYPYAVDEAALVQRAQPVVLANLDDVNRTSMATEMNGAADVQIILDGLNKPYGIAAGLDGRIYVADTGNRRLLILNQAGAVTHTITQGNTPFAEPFDVAVDRLDQVYVMDVATGHVSVFDADGNFLRLVPLEADIAQLRGLFVDGEDKVWLAHTGGGKVVAVDQNGRETTSLTAPPGQNFQPVDVAIGRGGAIFVTDGGEHQLLLFSPQGELRFAWAIPVANTLNGSHLAVDSKNFLYMTQPETANVAQLDPTGVLIAVYGLRTAGVVKPVGIAVDPSGRIWVADGEGGQIALVTPSLSPQALQQNLPASSRLPAQPASSLPSLQPVSPLVPPPVSPLSPSE